jgi:hypothetical protein
MGEVKGEMGEVRDGAGLARGAREGAHEPVDSSLGSLEETLQVPHDIGRQVLQLSCRTGQAFSFGS